MKTRQIGLVALIVGLIFIRVTGFAADGDLIVNGNTSTASLSINSSADYPFMIENATGYRVFADAWANFYTEGSFINQRSWTPTLRMTTMNGWVNFNFSLDTSANLKLKDNSGNPIAYFGQNGNTAMGGTDPGSYRLYVSGTAYSTGGWQSSDMRFKENVRAIESPLGKILSLEGVVFDWKRDEFRDKGFPDGRHYGVIAQKVERVLPEVVRGGPGGEKTVSYTEIIPVLIEAMKEQQQTIVKQQGEIEELKAAVMMNKVSLDNDLASLR